MPALYHIFLIDRHVVAQVVEAYLVIGAVGYVAGVGGAALILRKPVHYNAAGKAHKAVDLSHKFPLVRGEVIVYGDDMHAVARKGVQICGKGRGKRFSIARLHFGDAPLVKHHAAEQLYSEGVLTQNPAARLAEGGVRLGQNIVERLAVRQTRFQPRRLRLKFAVGHRGVFARKRLYRVDRRVKFLYFAGTCVPEEFFQKCVCHIFRPFTDRVLIIVAYFFVNFHKKTLTR